MDVGRVGSGRLLSAEIVRALDRDHRDLVISLRALAALLREPPPDPAGESPVLARILDAELNQLAILMGEVAVALRVEERAAGPVRPVDLRRTLDSAVRRSGRAACVRLDESPRPDDVVVCGHPDVIRQVVASALALVLRAAEGPIVAGARRSGREAVVWMRAPVAAGSPSWTRWSWRVGLLRRIVAAEGGRLTVERTPTCVAFRIAFAL